MESSREQMFATRKIEEIDGENNLIILGAGPGGLVTALVVQLNQNPAHHIDHIIIVERRPEDMFAIRPQIVFLNDEVRTLLKDYMNKLKSLNLLSNEGEKLLKAVSDPKEHIAIKDIQRFLNKRVVMQNCMILYSSLMTDIDVAEKKMTIESTTDQGKVVRNVHFKYLVVADAGDSENTKKLTDNGLSIKINTVFESQHRYMVSAYMIVRRKDGMEFDLPNMLLHQIRLKDSGSFGYLYYNRSSHAKTNKQAGKFFITFSVPKHFYQEFQMNKQLGLHFLQNAAETVFNPIIYDIAPVKNSKDRLGVGPAKDKLKYQLFERTFYQAETSAIEKNGITVLWIGNAFKSPDFFQGIGLNHATLQGRDAGRLITGRITLVEFRENSEKLAREQLEKVIESENSKLPNLKSTANLSEMQTSSAKELQFSNEKIRELYNQLKAWYRELKQQVPSDQNKNLHHDLLLTRKFIEAFETYPDTLLQLYNTIGQIDLEYPGQKFFPPTSPTLSLLSDVTETVGGLHRQQLKSVPAKR